MYKPFANDILLPAAGLAATLATNYMQRQMSRKSPPPSRSNSNNQLVAAGPRKPSPYPVVIRRAYKAGSSSRRRRGRGRKLRRVKGRKSRKGPVAYMSRKKILDILTVPNAYTLERFDTQTLPPNTATSGPKSVYFAMNNTPGATPQSLPYGTRDPFVLRAIANIITNGALNPSISYNIINAEIVHHLTNASNCNLKITAYKCAARNQFPPLAPYSSSIQAILGRGYCSAGYDSSVNSEANAGCFQAELTPFQSPLFCQSFKVLSSQIVNLAPGATKTFVLRDRGFHASPNLYVSMTAAQSYDTGTPLVEWMKGETFYLWKIEQNQVSNDIVSTDSGAAGFAKVNMHTKLRWNYKFTQDNQRSITVTSAQNFVVPGAATSVRFINQLQAAIDTMKTS